MNLKLQYVFYITSYPCTGRRGPEVEAPIFSDIRYTDGGKVVSPTRGRFLLPGRFMPPVKVKT
jgi:hypothetical protein